MTLSVDLTQRYTGFDLSAQFDAGAGVTAIFGRSGAGKTTVVKAVTGLIRADAPTSSSVFAATDWRCFTSGAASPAAARISATSLMRLVAPAFSAMSPFAPTSDARTPTSSIRG